MSSTGLHERTGGPAAGESTPGTLGPEFTGGGSAKQTLAALLRKWKFWILLGVVVVVVLVGTFLLRSGGTDQGILSPNNPAPDGAMAAAEILEQQGVDIEPAETLAGTLDALEAAGAQNATLLIHDRLGLLNGEQLRQLEAAEAEIVLVEPSIPVLDVFAPEINSAGVVPEPDDGGAATLQPQCSLADPQSAGPIDRGGAAYRGGQMCYPVDSGQAPASASYVQSDDGTVTVLGNGGIVSNDRLAQHGNAALTLRTLGAAPTLIWYQPSLADIAIDDGAPQLGELVPPWVNAVMVWLLIVAVLAMMWKARRTGPLVVEPLPVIAKAAETAEGRARLYQDSRAFGRAADSLRAGTLMRLAAHFRLGHNAGTEVVVRAAAEASTLDWTDVGRILLRERPGTDAALLSWAQELDKLEKEVTAR